MQKQKQSEEIIIKQERTHVLRYLEPWLLSKVSRKIDLHLKKLQIQGAAEYFSVCHTMAYNTHLTVEIIKKYNLINETCIIPLLENNYLYDMKTCRSLYRKELTEKYTLQTFGKDIGGYILQFLYYFIFSYLNCSGIYFLGEINKLIFITFS